MANFPYKSYCWCIGTTSYRTEHFNLSIEQQLILMHQFKKKPECQNKTWQELQRPYYYFLKENNFLTGEAQRPEKDAREKTSGLVDIGLLNNERDLSNAGKRLLEICENNDFSPDNFLDIDKDSFIYLKQLLKTSNNIDGNIIRPFIVFLYLEAKLEYLTDNEFKYLLPLCINLQTTKLVEEKIRSSRKGNVAIDDILIHVIMSMQNYQKAYKYLLSNKVTEKVLCDIGMNRKSKTYDKSYFPFYKSLEDVVLNNKTDLLPLYETIKKISGKPKTFWINYLFKDFNRSSIKNKGRACLTNAAIFNVKSKKDYKDVFFKTMHLFKMKSTLSDYMDLNRRYFKITETVIFSDNKVELDIMPKCYFSNIADELLTIAFVESERLLDDVTLLEISTMFNIDKEKLYVQLGVKVGKSVTTPAEAKQVVKDERYTRFNKLIDEKFSNEAIIDLLNNFDSRNDTYLRSYITDNANAPTMFEYILGIAWYKISERKGDILDYMNLSLDADLLPKTHAGGGEADIVYLYEATHHYPKHTLLIEVTLAENAGQRVLEMEPVSRHIGEYCLKNKDEEAYCVFISTRLLLNLISDFRARKTTPYFSSDGEDSVAGTKILPLKTDAIKTILKKNIKYSDLYLLFNQAYLSTIEVKDWYDSCITQKIENDSNE